jgi:DHA2 family multidrug resistance protein
VLYGASTSLPGLLQNLFGYDAYVSGLVQSPSGFFSIMGLVVVGALISLGIDARWFIAGGLLIMAAGNYWMALMNLYISPGMVVWPRVVLIIGLSMIFVAINVAAFKYIPPHLRGAAVGLFALLRNEGGSVGTSMAQAIQWRRSNFHQARVGEFIDPLNPYVNAFSEQGRAFFFQQTGDPAASQEMTWQALENLRDQQAASLAYFDVFWLFAVLALSLVLLVPLMKRSVAEKGEHIGGE